MHATQLDESDVLLIHGKRYSDVRGHLTVIRDSEAVELRQTAFVLTKYSYSHSGVLRGLHYQAPPMSQGKLVSILRGTVFLAAVDIRRGSPWFGRPSTIVLSEEEPTSLWIPEGYALGSLSMADSIILYHLTKEHSPECEGGIKWNDPTIDIHWPNVNGITVSKRDRQLPSLSEVDSGFRYPYPD